jgi:Na+/phosphate symporter
MHVEIYVSLLVAILGALVYLLSMNQKWYTLGLVSFGAGLLAFLMRASAAHFGIG